MAVIVSLPNQLFGHIPITGVSPWYTRALEDEARDEQPVRLLFCVPSSLSRPSHAPTLKSKQTLGTDWSPAPSAQGAVRPQVFYRYTTKAKYRSVDDVVIEVMWVMSLLKEM